MSAPKPARAARPGDDGEDATATVELAILLPVYAMLFVGLLTIGHLVLIRQKIVEAVRFQAWLPGDARTNNNGGVTNNFFATYQPFSNGPGYAQLTKTIGPFTFDDAGLFQGVYQSFNATQAQRQLAIDVLNDAPNNGGTARHLYTSHVEGKYTYRPDWVSAFLNAVGSEPKTMCTVLVRASYQQGQGVAPERKVLRFDGASKPWEVSDHDPIEDYLYPHGGNADPGFPISIEQNNAHDRFYTPGAPDDTQTEQGMTLDPGLPDSGNPDPGIWNTGYRLGGSVQAERGIYHRMLYGN